MVFCWTNRRQRYNTFIRIKCLHVIYSNKVVQNEYSMEQYQIESMNIPTEFQLEFQLEETDRANSYWLQWMDERSYSNNGWHWGIDVDTTSHLWVICTTENECSSTMVSVCMLWTVKIIQILARYVFVFSRNFMLLQEIL